MSPPAERGGGGVKVGEQERAARRQDAGEFVHGSGLIANVTERQRAEHEVSRPTRDGERGGIGGRKPAAQPGFPRRHGEHGR
jgi:hypothetical protein